MIILIIIIANILSDYFVLVTILSNFHELNPCVLSLDKWGIWDMEVKSIHAKGERQYGENTKKKEKNYRYGCKRVLVI